MTMLSIPFEYQSAVYHALARVKEKAGLTEYHITVMNGKLEKLLYGNHIITCEQGTFRYDVSGNSLIDTLKGTITEALNKYLQYTREVVS